MYFRHFYFGTVIFNHKNIQFRMEQIKKSMRDSAAVRWSILLLVSFVMAANYYFYDALSPLKSILEEHLNFTSTDFGIVVGFYAFPNTFLLMAVLGGIILDRIGIRITGFVFVFFMVLGALLTFYGTTEYFTSGGFGYHFFGSFWLKFNPAVKVMALGMLLFGLGAETSIVVINKIMVKWFKGYEIALAFAINLGIARLGTALAYKVGPRLIQPTWNTPVWLATLLICIAFLAFLVYLFFDKRIDKQLVEGISVKSSEDEFHISDIGKLLTNKTFLYITILCVTFYAAVFPFLKYAPDFFFNNYGVSRETSGDITFWLPIGTVFFTPVFGWFVDNKGKSASLMIYGSVLLLMAHLLFAFTTINPYILVVVLGIAFSLVPAAMWPSVAKIVDESKIGTAYGLMFSFQNLGLFAIPILAGVILDATNKNVPEGTLLNYSTTILMFAVFGLIALFFAFLLKKESKTSGYGLELPNKTKE